MPGYANTGPFTNNATPGISATFLNNIENFLDSITSAPYDSHITADGSGNLTVVSLVLPHGSVHAIAWGSIASCTNSGTTITHGLGGTPGIVIGQVQSATGQTGAVTTYTTSIGATTFIISTNSISGFPVNWFAIR